MQHEPVKGSAKESPRKVDARDNDKTHSSDGGKPSDRQQQQSTPAQKQQGGASSQQKQGDSEVQRDLPLSDPPLRKGLHESVPRD